VTPFRMFSRMVGGWSAEVDTQLDPRPPPFPDFDERLRKASCSGPSGAPPRLPGASKQCSRSGRKDSRSSTRRSRVGEVSGPRRCGAVLEADGAWLVLVRVGDALGTYTSVAQLPCCRLGEEPREDGQRDRARAKLGRMPPSPSSAPDGPNCLPFEFQGRRRADTLRAPVTSRSVADVAP